MSILMNKIKLKLIYRNSNCLFNLKKSNNYNQVFFYSTKSKGQPFTIKIDDVEQICNQPENSHLVPRHYVQTDENGNYHLSQTSLHHLKWMLQKDQLKQDMFLLGSPGPLRRNLAMQFLEITKKESEYIALSRDTTESDLKQRREIRDRAAKYYDQCAVRAAVDGRVLILDGVEHTERNVLPILNNLLENREMHLENGKFLMAADRYDKLLETNTKEELDKWGLIRVSENFRVIALGLSTEKYKGTPLDPPLRSRFQSRNVSNYSFEEIFKELMAGATELNVEKLKKIIKFALAINLENTSLPDFPIDSLKYLVKIMNLNPNLTIHEGLCYLYPYQAAFSKDSTQKISTLLTSLNIEPTERQSKSSDKNFTVFNSSTKEARVHTPESFIEISYQQQILDSMKQMYAVSDFCLIGPKGVGKSILTERLLQLIGKKLETMYLYEDMTARDLIQQRITTPSGDTIWRDSPLVSAIKNGHVCVLDGINRLHKSTTTILQRLIHDRELELCDGTKLLREDRYDSLANEFDEIELHGKGIRKIHPDFRIIALAEPSLKLNQPNWLTPEILSLFLFQEIRPLQENEELELIQNLYGDIDGNIDKIIALSHVLRKSRDPILKNLAETLSTRQLLKIVRRIKAFPITDSNSVYEIMQNTFMTKFMPALPKMALENAMKEVGITKSKRSSYQKSDKKILVNTDHLKIGKTEIKLKKSDAESKIPSTLFYEMPQHIELLERLLQDFIIGDHILLVGNQGVGKNKLVDKLLQLMQKPREYLQLHRDTTVHNLTVQSTLQDGQVIFEDSPLVKAVKHGHVLVVDEADKAPINVTCILRTIVENNEITLSDGRKIVSYNEKINNPNLIPINPEFRMIVLANRPGFPFMGNDFFASLGDVFSCHVIDNPQRDSEIFLLQKYGPSVPIETLTVLVNAFGELRKMADEGLLNYPYSTREVVNLVKHLEKFGNASMSEVIGNVLDFDKYNPEALNQVTEILLKNGLDVGTYAKDELIAERRKKEIQLTVQRNSGLDVSAPKHGKVDTKNEPHVGGNTWAGGTGGRDTAGLGGKGGPYRLDAGHKVHQLSDDEKNAIPEEVKNAAREMNRKAFAEKLNEIKMAEHDYKIYAQFSHPIRKQVSQLKTILHALQTKSKERSWQKYQTSGELDDVRLIEGITGEKNIYKKRGENNPWAEQIQEKPNRLKLVVDVSGSMYRFNGYDGRLDRQLEAVVMVMESLEGFEKKIVYDIVGHSGEGHEIPFVTLRNPPKNDKERLETIKMMHAHSQFCWSGDNTLKATENAVETLLKEDNNNAIIIILSDANLSRYGIPPKYLGELLMKGEPKVQTNVIFIGGIADQAEELNTKMPAGHSFICLDLEILPQILKQIFASSLL